MRTRHDLQVINLAAGPGAGKSTIGAAIFNIMKRAGYRVELVTEVAKDLVYERNFLTLDNQLLVLAMQDHRLRRLWASKEVDWAVTDSPLYLSTVYAGEEFSEAWFFNTVASVYEQYTNHDILVHRVKPFDPNGRNQKTLEEAQQVDLKVRKAFDRYVPPGRQITVNGDNMAPWYVMQRLGLRTTREETPKEVPVIKEVGPLSGVELRD